MVGGFVSAFDVLLLVLVFNFMSSASISTGSVTPPCSIPKCSSPGCFPLPADGLLNSDVILSAMLVSDRRGGGDCCHVLHCSVPICYLVKLSDNSSCCVFATNSAQALACASDETVGAACSSRISGVCSLDLSSDLNSTLKFSGMSVSSTLPDYIAGGLKVCGSLFSCATARNMSCASGCGVVMSNECELSGETFLCICIVRCCSSLACVSCGGNP